MTIKRYGGGQKGAGGQPLLRARAVEDRVDGMELVLKGGQMGPPDLLLKAIQGAGAT